jgi:hypothetical protein
MSRYCVFVDDNRDPESRYEKGVYESADAALAICREMIDTDLAELHKPDMTAEALYVLYRFDGRDPFIVPLDGAAEVDFSSWRYAEERAAEICGEAGEPIDEAEAPGAPRFLAFPAKRLIVLRVDGEATSFWNPRLKTWQLWRQPIPSTALAMSKADVWQLIRYDYAGYDFGELRPRWRESPTGSDC